MALRRDAVAGNKVVREKKFFFGLFGWWTHDYEYQNTTNYHKLQMNKAVDLFAMHMAELKLEEHRQKMLIKEIGSSSGKLKSWGPCYHIPGSLASPKERKKFTKPLVGKQNDDWKPFARNLYDYGTSMTGKTSGGGQTKNLTIDVVKPTDLHMEGGELDVFQMPRGNQNNNNRKNKGGSQNGQHHNN